MPSTAARRADTFATSRSVRRRRSSAVRFGFGGGGGTASLFPCAIASRSFIEIDFSLSSARRSSSFIIMSRIVRISAIRAAAPHALARRGVLAEQLVEVALLQHDHLHHNGEGDGGREGGSCREPTIISSPQQQQPWTACAVRSTPSCTRSRA